MLKKDLYNMKIALIIIFLYCFFMQITFHAICPLKAFFNIDCPACGLTRATLCFFTGNFKQAFEYNASFPLWLISIFLFFIDKYIYKIKIKPFPVLFIICSISTIFLFIIKKML